MAEAQQATLTLTADLPDQRLDALTRDLARDLARLGVQARPATRKAAAGERGELVAIGALVLTFVASEIAKEAAKEIGKDLGRKLIECIKAYLTRERTAKITLTRADGAPIVVDRQNVDSAQTRKAIEDLPLVAS
jgi:hypothetical protein